MASIQPTVIQLIEDTPDLPVMPAQILRVMHLAGEPTSSASQLAEAICAEPALAARVLRFANSAYYGMSGQVTTIQGGVVLLGIKTVRNLAMVAASHAWFVNPLNSSCQVARTLWDHAIGVAAGANAIASLRASELANEAFCSGLLHDIGKSVLSVRLGEGLDLITERASEHGVPVHEAERMVLGFDHTEVGLALAQSWNLPVRLQQPIRYHHTPNDAEDAQTLVDIIHVADVLYWRSQPVATPPVAVCDDAFRRLGVDGVHNYEMLVATMLEHQEELDRLIEAA